MKDEVCVAQTETLKIFAASFNQTSTEHVHTDFLEAYSLA